MPIKEFHLNKILEELQLTQDEFIDLCILLGCDYCESIRGIGPKRAIELIRQHRSIEKIVEKLDGKKYSIPEDWLYQEARKLFQAPEVLDLENLELKWSDPDEEGLVKFLCGDKGFSEERVRNGAKKLMKGRHSSTQGRLDSFFKVLPNSNPIKRKVEQSAPSRKKTKKEGTGHGRGRRPK